MEFKLLDIEGVYEINLFHAEDERGGFTKTFHKQEFEENGLNTSFAESYFSGNKSGVIRGMHFQLPPEDHHKLVYVTSGKVLDVVLDLRKNSGTFGKHVTINLSANKHNAVYMPKGVAHGFCCLEDANMVYMTGTVYNRDCDAGILWNSFNMNWPVENPVVSERDQSFATLENFKSPF